MPCYTVQTFSVEFKAENTQILEATLKELKMTYTKVGTQYRMLGGQIMLDPTNQKAELTGDKAVLQHQLNKIKKGYSVQTLRAIALKEHWQYTQSGGKILLIRR